ncbi:probable E3 ubiquitin-protein ligase ATL45 [Phragmites australis]|uniref:probable E3 ubiquitin-protein ligase ATL45 n=1 Tax=Phragmites australis TaxID=29695 RepID=UPI002D77E3D3|nr:probable E3 ubiquitin-protein ligase ATL45 [Phragmites australis]
MSPDAAFALEIAAVVTVTVLIVAIVVAASGACDATTAGAGRAAVHDVERALSAATLMTYEEAAAAGKGSRKVSLPTQPSTEGKEGGEEEPQQCCAICLSEYAKGDELVRVVPACGHFFHAECDVDRWLRARRTCPICRGQLWPLPGPPRPECPPMPPRGGGATAGSP